MKFSIRHIMLLTGILMVILSFFFFSRENSIYTSLLLTGIILSGVSYVLILFKEDSIKLKLFWTLIVICSVAIQYLTEQPLIKKSYSIFINENDQALNKANEIMTLKPDGIYAIDTSDLIRGKLTELEFSSLKVLRDKAGIRFISKVENRIFYCLSGAIDVYNGVFFIDKVQTNGSVYKHLKDKWYY